MKRRLNEKMNDYSHNFPSTPNLAQKGSVFEDMAWIVSSTVDVSYDVSIQERIFDTENTSLKNKIGELGDARQLIFLDENVERLHGDRIAAYFETHNIPVTIHIVTVSEEKKSLETALNLLRHLEENNTLRRSAPFIAIGGGVLLDLAGFAASLYRRGIPHIRIPTNLMALIDASIGVKSGINIWDRRNRLGTYNAPGSVLLDRSFLKTVCARELSNGLAEILKLAVIKDAELFGLLESAGSHLISSKMQDDEFSPSVIARAAHGMLEELAPNLWERKLERCVDFGHSFSPMVEMLSLPELLHGEAVAMDVLLSCILAEQRGLLRSNDVERVAVVMRALGLQLTAPKFKDVDTLWASLEDATRHRNGKQRLPLPNGIGSFVFVNDITRGEVERASKKQTQLAGEME